MPVATVHLVTQAGRRSFFRVLLRPLQIPACSSAYKHIARGRRHVLGDARQGSGTFSMQYFGPNKIHDVLNFELDRVSGSLTVMRISQP